ncbi:MAG: ImmA/IrrE family metallo-endopeptidase [Litorimonas sp.]
MVKRSAVDEGRLSLEQVYEAARSVLEEHWGKNSPVNLKRLAKRMGIVLEFAPFKDQLSGISFIDDGKSYIGVNSLHSTNRQRFTIAHEIGHHVLHQELLKSGTHVDTVILRRDHLSAEGIDRKEIEANAFASELLVPRFLLESRISDDTDMQDEELVRKLANELQISSTALHFRLARA